MGGVEEFARAVHRRTVGEVPAMQQAHPQDGVAGIDQGGINRIVGRRSRERLHVDENVICGVTVGRKQLGAAPAGQLFDDIGIFNAFVITRV